MRYFRKANPKVSVLLSNGTYAQFEKVDHQTAIMATVHPFLLAEFEACIQNNRAGIVEIDAEEYARLKDLKKNGGTSKPLWREELTNQEMRIEGARRQQQLAVARAAASVARAEPMITVSEVPLEAAKQTVVEPVLDANLLKPPVSKKRPPMPPKKP
jgi:hypothetical protein